MMESQIEEFLDFCRRFPVEKVDAERFIRNLSHAPLSLIDLRAKGVLGVILDRALDPSGAAPFEWVGASAASLDEATANTAIQEILVRARALKVPTVHILITNLWRGAEPLLQKAGATTLYHDLDMTHADSGWGLDLPLPKGWMWVDVTSDLENQYIALLRRSFGRQLGLYMPSQEDMIAGLRDPAVCARLLLDADKTPRALMRCRSQRRYIHAIGRDPDYQRRGLGQMALDEARRVLGAGPLHLSVVKENSPALNLYMRLGFAVESEMPTWSLPVP